MTSHVPYPARTLRALCLLLLAAALGAPAAAQAAPPPNDDFAAAQDVRVGDRVTGTTVDATFETGEPATTSDFNRATVWFRFTPTASERVRIDSCGSDRHTELAVYAGAGVDALTELTHSQHECPGAGRVYLDAVAGTTYHVRATGITDFSGDIVLAVARPQVPANDAFANGQVLGLPARVAGTNADATVEPGEVDPSPFGSGHSVWYRVTSAGSASVTVSLGACGNATSNMLAVYTGTSLGNLTPVGEVAPACGFRQKIVLFPRGTTTYHVAVRGNGRSADEFVLTAGADLSAPPLPTVLPPTPTCPFQLARPAVTYRGTHSGGGEVCVTVKPDFSGVDWFHAIDLPRDFCDVPWAVERLDPAAPIADRHFGIASSSARVTGSFPTARGAQGTFRLIHSTHNSTCVSRVLTWTATTTATPPWALPDLTPPALRLRGAAVQRPLRSDGLVVTAACGGDACRASASATVAGIRLAAAPRAVRAGGGRTLKLVLSARARRAVRSALRARRSTRTRVTVVARDAAGNRATARRTITLRR